MTKRVAGVCYFKVNGEQFSVAGECTVSPEESERESLTGLAGVAGYKEMPRAAFIEVEVFTTENFDIQNVAKVDDGTVTAELANGQVWALRNAWKVGASDMSANNGTTTIRFEGPKCERVQ